MPLFILTEIVDQRVSKQYEVDAPDRDTAISNWNDGEGKLAAEVIIDSDGYFDSCEEV